MRAIHYWLGVNEQCASIARIRSLFCKKGLQGPIAAYSRGDPCVQQITCKEDWAFSRHLLKSMPLPDQKCGARAAPARRYRSPLAPELPDQKTRDPAITRV